jgi:hypothetical protein
LYCFLPKVSHDAYKILVQKPEEKRYLERSKYGWEDNVKLASKEAECDDMDWIHLA